LKVVYVSEGTTPDDSSGYPDIDAAVTAVNQEVLEEYAAELGERVLGFQYAWFAWGDHKPPKNAGLSKDFYLMFEIRGSEGDYAASLPEDASIQLRAATLKELTDATQAATFEKWPILRTSGIPGVMHWNRELAAGQFRDI
jgi:hypothetical protein